MLFDSVIPALELGFISLSVEDKAVQKLSWMLGDSEPTGHKKTWLEQYATTTQGWGPMTETLIDVLKYLLEKNMVDSGSQHMQVRITHTHYLS